jgi:catechol 2,3-dioxygenase-like lactoylglutathione lyase family enzyme
MRKRPAIPRIDGDPQTVLLVEDVERAVAFYTTGLRLELRDGDTGRYAELDTGDGGLLVLVRRDGSIAPMAIDAADDAPPTLTFAIDPEGYDTWKKWFAKCGVTVERETKWIHGGCSLFVRDPDGRRLEFKTPPVVTPPKPTPLPEKKPED